MTLTSGKISLTEKKPPHAKVQGETTEECPRVTQTSSHWLGELWPIHFSFLGLSFSLYTGSSGCDSH